MGLDRGHVGPRVDCGQGHQAEFVSYRGKPLDTLLGPFELSRAYYHCSECQHGVVPKDRELGVVGATISPGLAKVVASLGSDETFGQSRLNLLGLAGVALSTKRIERFTESIGGQLQTSEMAEREAMARGMLLPLAEQTAALTEEALEKETPADELQPHYVLMDGTGVPTVAKETEGWQGKGPDGRARGREVKAGLCLHQSVGRRWVPGPRRAEH